MRPARLAAHPRPQLGFSMVELLVVLIIAAILATAAAPGMRSLIRDNAGSALVNELSGALRFARSAAIERRRPTTLCSLTAGACSGDATKNFADGWIIFLDSDGDGVKDADDADGDGEVDAIDEPVLREYRASRDVYGSLRLAVVTPRAGANRRVVSFDWVGQLRTQPGAPDPQTRFVYCDAGGNATARAVYVTFAGTTLLAGDADGNGKDDYAGNDFNCPT